jgi:hypothetical protein
VRGAEPGRDELVVTHDVAVRDHEVVNTGTGELVAYLFFGPDLHADVPVIATRTG